MMNLNKTILLVGMAVFMQLAAAQELQGVVAWPVISKPGFAVSGVVDKVKVQAGAQVKKGDTLVQLEQRPFLLDVKKYKAGTETIEPLLFDARVELNQAEELYDRTVLSQIELQKIEARHRGLEAQARVAQAEYEMALWRQEKSSLAAPFDAVVVSNDFISGQVLSEENRAHVSLQLAPTGMMAVIVLIEAQQLPRLQLNQPVQVIIGADKMPGMLRSIDVRAGNQTLSSAVIDFKYPSGKRYHVGQNAKIKLP
jgi:multidrug efflux system membrane fusion protein